MCIQPIKIRSFNPVSPQLAWIPCGKCEECRKSLKNSWSMRLALELETCQSKGWQVGFCTLTYNDENLPRFPPAALDYASYVDYGFPPADSLPPCFDRQQVRDFIVNLRRDLDSDFGAHGLKYMICSEYGSNTQRPHYHCVFSWPPEVSASQFFALICKYWHFGFVFPKDLNGGRDSHGYEHMPFVVQGSGRFAAAYAGKYCCKDMDFQKSLVGFRFDKKSKEFRNGDCFHIQNKSLGLSWLLDKSEDDLRKYLFKGIGFAGDEKLHQMPLYLRNKIYFSPLYIVERRVYDLNGVTLVRDGSILQKSDDDLKADGFRVEYKRLVRRQCTDFFHKNFKEIYKRKVDFWTDTFRSLSSEESFPLLQFVDSEWTPEKVVRQLEDVRKDLPFSYLAEFYVSRYGLPQKYQFDAPDVDVWAMRYTMRKIPDCFKDYPLIGEDVVKYMSNLVSLYLGFLGLSFATKDNIQERVERLRDFYKHLI